MKLYCFPVAPNPTRVMVFCREKHIPLEEVTVHIGEGQHKAPEHLARNPRGTLPVLELDDGSYISESLPIMEYLEECHPEPNMIGDTPQRRLQVRALERQAEFSILQPIARFVHATNSPTGQPANPGVAEVASEAISLGYQRMDTVLAETAFLAGKQPTVADCTLFAGLFFGEFFGVQLPDEYSHLRRWYEAFKQRPSTQLM